MPLRPKKFGRQLSGRKLPRGRGDGIALDEVVGVNESHADSAWQTFLDLAHRLQTIHCNDCVLPPCC